ncbi:MFS transporter [Streptomyces sp. 71268]|uniref:MFS transporter n=1 Tax=Streptomyces sp. 71268 TaxID=3002640 RepID=UPI0023F7DDB0|nr:MFS transporter [Streptomyces sp. 71268]WEV26627.1 MFS transporter [Streptomyces sp. 71268]
MARDTGPGAGAGAGTEVGARGKWWPLVAITLGNFMLIMDVTIVNTALPEIARDLDASFTSLQWVMDIYALALAALLMAAGSAADLFGRRRLYLLGLAVFALSSLACGLAPDPGLLIAARALQGVGAAAMFATNTPLLMATYAGRDRGVAFGVWGGTSGAAAAVGPVLGGVLTEGLDWRAIFLVNLPLTVFAGWLTLRTVGESTGRAGGRVDVAGVLLFTGFAGALTYGLIRGGEEGWGDAGTALSLGAAGLALVGFVLVERRLRQPMFDLGLLRSPAFVVLMVAAVVLQASAFPYLTYVAMWLQSVLGMSPIEAGLAVTPLAVAALVVGVIGGRLLSHLPPRVPVSGGLLLVGAGALLNAALVDGDAGWAALAPGLAVAGLGVGLATPVLVSAALGLVPGERAGMASGAVNTSRQFGYALGIAVLGTVFAARVRSVFTDGTAAAAAAPETAAGAPDPEAAGHAAEAISGGHAADVVAAAPPGPARHAVERLAGDAFVAGIDRVCLISGVVAVAAALLVFAVVRDERGQGDRGSAGGQGGQADEGGQGGQRDGTRSASGATGAGETRGAGGVVGAAGTGGVASAGA